MKYLTLLIVAVLGLYLTGCVGQTPQQVAIGVHRDVDLAVLALDTAYITGVLPPKDYVALEPYVKAVRAAEAVYDAARASGGKADINLALQAVDAALLEFQKQKTARVGRTPATRPAA